MTDLATTARAVDPMETDLAGYRAACGMTELPHSFRAFADRIDLALTGTGS